MTDVIDLIMEDHARIQRLFAALYSSARYRAQLAGAGERRTGHRMLSETWARLSLLLELHIDAEEEICYPAACAPRRRDAAIEASFDDHRDIREVLAEARLRETDSLPWWRAVAAAHTASSRHFRAEEEHVLPVFRRSKPGLREILGRQWAAFTRARLRDLAEAQPHSAGHTARDRAIISVTDCRDGRWLPASATTGPSAGAGLLVRPSAPAPAQPGDARRHR